MTPWAKIGIIVGWTMICGLIGWHLHSWKDGADRAKELAAEQAHTDQVATERDKIASDYEAYKNSSQSKMIDIENKWRAYEKTDKTCILSPAAIGLLKSVH